MFPNEQELTLNEKVLIKTLLAKSLFTRKEQYTQAGQYTYVTIPTDKTASCFEVMRYSESEFLGGGGSANVFKAEEIDTNTMQLLKIPKKHTSIGVEYKTKMFALKKFHASHSLSKAKKEAAITREFYETKNAFSPFWLHSCFATEFQKGVAFQPNRNVLHQLEGCSPSERIKGAIDLLTFFHRMHNTNPNRDYIIIHGDIHGGNILFHVGKNHKIRLRPIDFSASEYVSGPLSAVKTYNANCIAPPEGSVGSDIVSDISYTNENYMYTASDIYGLSYVLHLLFASPATLPGEDLAHINGSIIDFPGIFGSDITEHVYTFIKGMRYENPFARPNTCLCLQFLNTILALTEIPDDKLMEKTGLMAKLILITSGNKECINQVSKIDFTAPEQHENCQKIIDIYNANHISDKVLRKITRSNNSNINIAELQQIVQQMLPIMTNDIATTTTSSTTNEIATTMTNTPDNSC